MLKKLRIKFVCTNMVIVMVILSVVFSILIYSTRKNLEDNSIHLLQTVATNAPDSHVPPMRPNFPQKAVRLPYFVLHESMDSNLVITDGNYYDLSNRDFLQEILAQVKAAQEDMGVLHNYNLRYYRIEMPLGLTVAFADTTAETATMHSLFRTCLIISISCFCAFLFISILLARWAIRPVEQAWNQQKQFVADASHELKTPLTIILTNAEMLQSPDYDEAYRQQFTGSILTMAHQMRGLVEGLLELARVDNGIVQKSFSPLDLSQAVNDAVLPFEPVIFETGMTLQTQIDEGIHVKGSEPHLRQVVEIFLDNAMKYGDEHGLITVDLHQKGNHCLLAVANTGPAIAQDDLKNIFKRFYRVDTARSMNHSYGLGLSIAGGIIKDHRGRIWAESDRGFNTFYVQLPMI